MVNHTGTKLVKYIHRKGPLVILINKKISMQKDILNNDQQSCKNILMPPSETNSGYTTKFEKF